MTRCEKCGTELKEDSAFCQNCGAPVTVGSSRIIDLSGWGARIIAFIIDAIIFGIVIGIIGSIIALPSITWYEGMPIMRNMPFVSSGVRDLLFFIYFVWMDYSYGQSIGKMIMRIKVTNMEGGPIDLRQALIESFGKGFGALIFLDVILGWIFTSKRNQRIFNYLSGTIVVKMGPERS